MYFEISFIDAETKIESVLEARTDKDINYRNYEDVTWFSEWIQDNENDYPIDTSGWYALKFWEDREACEDGERPILEKEVYIKK